MDASSWGTHATWTLEVCRIMALLAVYTGLGPLFYILWGSRYSESEGFQPVLGVESWWSRLGDLAVGFHRQGCMLALGSIHGPHRGCEITTLGPWHIPQKAMHKTVRYS